MSRSSNLSNLSAWLPAVIDREQATTDCVAQLAGGTRLLTLTGPGGVGKSSLALHVAKRVLGESGGPPKKYEDGVWWIDLAEVRDVEQVESAVLSALGQCSHQSQTASLLEAKRLLLVLDTIEHLLPDSARWIDGLLRTCPHLDILGTSREPLRSPYEQVWPVAPLAFPSPNGSLTMAQAKAFPAVRLFFERAHLALPTFTLDQETIQAVVRICHSLDGLPLAIELAAGCVGFLTPEQIAEQLERGLSVLGIGHRTKPPRQQSLQATIAWSYQLLSPEEQRLFRRLSVVSGRFSEELAAEIEGHEDGHNELQEATGTTTLRSLVLKSLVTAEPVEQRMRYRILEMPRHFGLEQLTQAHESEVVYRRYCAWVARLAETAAASIDSDGQVRWLDRLEAELPHLRAALQWLVEHGDVEQRLHLASILSAFWRQRGYLSEGQYWLESAIVASVTAEAEAVDLESPGWKVQLASARNALGVLLMWQGRYPEARSAHEQSLSIWRDLDHRRGQAMTLFRLGFLAEKGGDYGMATSYLRRSESLFAEDGDLDGVDMARNRLGITAWKQGRYDEASVALEASLSWQRQRGRIGGAASTLLNLGVLATEEGRFAAGSRYLQESLLLNRRLGDRDASVYSLVYLGESAGVQADDRRAALWFQEALGEVEALAAEGRRLQPELEFRLVNGIGATVARGGQELPAARLWGAMEEARARNGLIYRETELEWYEREVGAARRRAGGPAFLLAWSEGAAMEFGSVLACASSSLARAERPAEKNGAENSLVGAVVPRLDTSLCISSLGPTRIQRGEHVLTSRELVYAKAQELLLYLLEYPRRTKAQIALALWPEATDVYVRSTFRVVLYYLRRALGDADWIVRESPSYYVFNRRRDYWYDARALSEKVEEATRERNRGNPEQAIALLEAALDLYRGDFGEGLPLSEWVLERQESFRGLHLQILLALGDLYLSRREGQRALPLYLEAVRREKYSEAAYRGTMRCYLELHEPGAARRQYQRLCRDLWEDLRGQPSVETTSLVEDLL